MSAIDWTKAYIVGMSVLILGLAVAILLDYMKVRTYESAYEAGMRQHYAKLVEEVEALRAYQDREEEGAKVDLDNPLTYISEQARRARIDQGIDFVPDTKPSPRKGYVDTTFKITLDGLIDRKRLADFLFQLENGSSLLKVARIDLAHARNRRGQDAEEDRWGSVVELGYRKAYVR